MKIYRAPFKCYYLGSLLNSAQLKRRLGEHKMSQSVPWGTSAVPKRVHYRVKCQPLKGSSAKRAFSQMRAPADKGDVRKVVLFIIPLCFAAALYG